jgi:hypothetical protein
MRSFLVATVAALAIFAACGAWRHDLLHAPLLH